MPSPRFVRYTLALPWAAAMVLLARPAPAAAQSGGCAAIPAVPAAVRPTLVAQRDRDRAARRFARPFECDADFGPPRVRIVSGAGRGTVPTVTVRFTAEDNVALDAQPEVTLDGAPVAVQPAGSAGSASAFTATVRLAPDRPHALEISVWDAAGNRTVRRALLSYDLSGKMPVVHAGSYGAEPLNSSTGAAPATEAYAGSASIATTAGAPDVLPNAGTTIERGLCLTIAAGGGAASECGDLRLVHALPSARSYNQARTPVLLYNTQHAHPNPLVAAQVTIPVGAGVPGGVTVTLRVNGVQRAQTTWPGNQFTPGVAHQVVVGFDGVDLATGVYPYTVEVTSSYAGTPYSSTVAGELAVVNHSGSAFGAGWWLAGWERLKYLGGNRMLWIGGDGSTRIYTQVTSGDWTRWTAPSVDRPDTLFLGSDPVMGSDAYWRKLPGGARVLFDVYGAHRFTVDRLQRRTTFWADASTGVLQALTLPVPQRTWNNDFSYYFTYGNPGGRLSSVTFYAGALTRTVTLANLTGGVGQVTSLTDPDSSVVTLGYNAGGPPQRRVHYSYDRRGTLVTYGYDMGLKLNTVTRYMQGTGADIAVTIAPQETRGIQGPPVPVDSAYTLFDGPRVDVPDVMRFWVDRWGFVWKTRNALGHTTTASRTDTRFPALVTALEAPNGLITRAGYNDRGNVDSTVVVNPLGDGRDAVTRYTYGNTTWRDFATRVTSPDGVVTEIGYDTAGNHEWQQDGRGQASRVTFGYNALGLLESVTEPAARTTAVSTHTLAYDGRGNVRRTRSALGIHTFRFGDALGRDTLVITPVSAGDSASVYNGGVRQRMVYDLADRVTETATTAPSHNNAPADTLRVVTQYDPAGLVRSVSRRSGPDIHSIGWITNEFRYDPAGRKTVEIAPPYAYADSTWYDPAGNVVEAHTRRGGWIVAEYDALNQPIRRTTPEDTARFTYDAQGAVLSATNRHARITRTYFPGGLLKTDSIRIRTSTPSHADTLWTGYTAHVYGLSYLYDLSGRRIRLTYPAHLLVNSGIADLRGYAEYGYDPVTGALAWVEGMGSATRFEYRYDTRGRPDSTYIPAGVREAYGYDGDNRMTSRYTHAPAGGSWFTGGALRNDSYSYDARNKMGASATVIGAMGIQHGAGQGNTYDGLGNLIGAVHVFDSPYTSESWRVDALGNRTDVVRFGPSAPGNVSYASTYQPGSGVLLHTLSVGDTTAVADTINYYYSLAGDNTGVVERGKLTANPRAGWNWQEPTYHQRVVETTSHFDSEGRLYDFRRLTSQENGAGLRIRESYAYDALGRRVWRRAWRGWDPATQTQRDTICLRPMAPSDCQSFVERTVWDGDQVVFESRAPSEPGASASITEQDVGFAGQSPHYGRVAYVHAGGIDQPVELVRMDIPDAFTAVPHANWRGTYDVLTLTGSRYATCGPQVGYPLGTQPECFPFNLESVSAFGESAPRNHDNTDTGPRSWAGSLLEGSRDASGMLYRRNRYVDPASGRFTQEDPIGLAGGLNLYGFAEGDPINYDDPYGLCPTCENAAILAIQVEGVEKRTGRDVVVLGAAGALAAGAGLLIPRALGLAGTGTRFLNPGVLRGSGDALRFTQRQLGQLRQLMGQGGDDAIRRAADLRSLRVPNGITRSTLQRYRAIAERALNPPSGKRVTETVERVQRARIRIIDEALKRLDY